MTSSPSRPPSPSSWSGWATGDSPTAGSPSASSTRPVVSCPRCQRWPPARLGSASPAGIRGPATRWTASGPTPLRALHQEGRTPWTEDRGSAACDGHRSHAEGRRGGGGLELQIVRHGVHAEQHGVEVRGDGDLAHRERDLPVLDPEACRAPGEIAGERVEAEPHHLRDEEATGGVGDELVAGQITRLHDEVRRRGADGPAAPGGAGGGLHLELSCRVAVQEVTHQGAAADDLVLAAPEPFAVVGAGTRTAGERGIVDDVDERARHGAPEAAEQVARLAPEGSADDAT